MTSERRGTNLWRAAKQASPVYAGLASGFRPRKRQTLTQWAEHAIVLPGKRSASPGPFRVGDAVYQRGMMDAVTDPDFQVIVFLTSSQVGKTSILTAAQGYYAEAEPSPQLSIFPTQIVADAYYDEQFKPTIDESPDLAGVFDGTNYPGGYIAFVGANNPSQLAMRPIRVVTGDELDRWPLSSGKEGSPVDLATKRMTTFRNRKAIWASTPVHTKTSQIVAMFKQCRQMYYLVVCPDCGHKQILKWDNVHYTKGKESEATYHCDECGSGWPEATKRRLVRDAEKSGGGWVELREAPFKSLQGDATPDPTKIGFYVCELYSPWSSMAEMAIAWSNAEGNPENEQTFINTRLGLPWDGNVTDFADADSLASRREVYSPKLCPKDAGLVTAAVDVQDDRLEVLTIAWGDKDESWLLEKIVLQHDPSVPATWQRLEETLARTYRHEAGKRKLGIEIAVVDSGGHFTQQAYAFCHRAEKRGRRWHAIKGVPGEGKPIWRKSDSMKRKGTHLVLIGVDDAKTTIYKRYAIERPGPGYIHIHEGFNEDDLKQMTAEHVEVEYDGKGFPKRNWAKKKGARNEMLDLLVYNLAARSDYDIDMPTRLRILNEEVKPDVSLEQLGAMFK